MAKTLRDVKAGDTICVVWQRPDRSNSAPIIEERVVEKVGTRYLYFTRHGWNIIKIDMDTGMSVHDDTCVRSNGRGCNAYVNESVYLQEQEAKKQLTALERRLTGRANGGLLAGIPHRAVMKIHAVLDEAGWNTRVSAQ